MIKLRTGILAAVGLATWLAACTPTPAADPEEAGMLSQSDAAALIQRLNEEWDAQIAAGNMEGAVAQYTDDAIRMEPGRPALVGRAAIATWLQSQFDRYTFEGSNTIDEVLVLAPDWILVRSHGEFTATPKAGGESIVSAEKWLGLLQRQPDGSWKYRRDCGSGDTPEPWKL